MDFQIDWLTLTLKPEKATTDYVSAKAVPSPFGEYMELSQLEAWLFDFLGLTKIMRDFKHKIGNVQHYNSMYSYNGIDIALANPEHFAEQGLMIRFSGGGVAYYEKYRRSYNKEWSWVTFLKEFFSLGFYGLKCKCTRIDLAYDDISYDDTRLISLDRIKKGIMHGELVSLFKKKNPRENKRVYLDVDFNEDYNGKNDLTGNTIYVGNRKSTACVRFYDKLKEQLDKKNDVGENIKHWVRMEFEFKQNRAMAVCDSLMMLSMEEFGTYMSQVVNRYIRFVKPNGDGSHNYRCVSRKWWRDIVGTIETARLAENKAIKSRYKSAKRWLERTVYPTLYAVLCCDSLDKFLTDVRQAGFEKQRHVHKEIIQDYISDKQEENLKGVDIHKITSDDFKNLVLKLEKTAKTNEMRAKGLELAEILSLEREYEQFHDVSIDGMYERRIFEFKNRKMLAQERLKDITITFRDLGVRV